MLRKLTIIFSASVAVALIALTVFKWGPIPTLSFSDKVDDRELVRRALQAKGLQSMTPVGVLKLELDASTHQGEETVLAINLGKNLAFLAGFEQKTGHLIAVSKDLASIRTISSVDLPGLAQKGILFEEFYDNMLGGFEQTTWNRIFRLDENNVFQQVFAYVKKTEYFWHDAWDKPDGLYWHRVNEDNVITFPSPDVIVVQKKTSRYIAPGDPKTMPTDYKLEGVQDQTIYFEWNPKTLRFSETKRTSSR